MTQQKAEWNLLCVAHTQNVSLNTHAHAWMKRSVQDRKRRQGMAFLRRAGENNPQEKCTRRITASAKGKGHRRRGERINLSHAQSLRPQRSHAHAPHRGREGGVTQLTPYRHSEGVADADHTLHHMKEDQSLWAEIIHTPLVAHSTTWLPIFSCVWDAPVHSLQLHQIFHYNPSLSSVIIPSPLSNVINFIWCFRQWFILISTFQAVKSPKNLKCAQGNLLCWALFVYKNLQCSIHILTTTHTNKTQKKKTLVGSKNAS